MNRHSMRINCGDQSVAPKKKTMPSFFLMRARVLLICIAFPVAAAAQLLAPPSTTPAPAASQDQLGRDTPEGSFWGFLRAAQAGNYSTASLYLQLSSTRRQTQGEDLATKLQVVLDRAFTGNIRAISNQPNGTPQDVAPDHQRIGTLSAGDVDADLDLIRVTDPS